MRHNNPYNRLGVSVVVALMVVASSPLFLATAGCTRRADVATSPMVYRVWATPTRPTAGQDLVLHARIFNKGDVSVAAGTKFRVAFAVDGEQVGVVDYEAPYVTPNGMIDVASHAKNLAGSFKYTATAGRHFIVAALADPDGPPDEAAVYPETEGAGLLAVSPTTTERRLRIMALGDSITGGTKSSTSYRYYLSKSLRESNFAPFSFVGSLDGIAFGQPPPDTDWDMRHEGHPGWTAEEIVQGTLDRRDWKAGKLGGAGGWANVYQPDVVLLDIGLNDLSQGRSPKQAAASVGQVVDALRKANPYVAIALAQVTPEWDGEFGSRGVPEFNDRLQLLALKKTTLASPIVVVDLYTGIDPIRDLVDGVHPTDDCHRKLADRWLPAVEHLASIVLARKPVPSTSLAMDEERQPPP
ncbi:MAG: SGNH/GDSL hydrolase family protein [Capsulimonadaceae bacterium]|nr:SGNH/GDSL hydrolase family protein [Capsulimonadaceae bacterium]